MYFPVLEVTWRPYPGAPGALAASAAFVGIETGETANADAGLGAALCAVRETVKIENRKMKTQPKRTTIS
jgi:hypothetical protein